MTPAHVVEITTPKKFLLRGLWFGAKRPRRMIIFVHGLGGSAFSMRKVVDTLVDQRTAVLTFNNRGHEGIAALRKKYPSRSLRYGGGAAHEVFTECVDDIQGAINFVRKAGVREIYLAGHSTGCQKSMYWAYKKGGKGINGIFLFAPISDWAAEMNRKGKKKILQATAIARALVRKGRKHALLPEGSWHEVIDAQRFLSLYTPDSPEEIFSYAQPHKNPRVLKSIRKPVLVLWAGKDEYMDRSAKDIARWFEKHIRNGETIIIPGVKHSFRGGEKTLATHVRRFIGR